MPIFTKLRTIVSHNFEYSIIELYAKRCKRHRLITKVNIQILCYVKHLIYWLKISASEEAES